MTPSNPPQFDAPTKAINQQQLLDSNEPNPWQIENAAGQSPFLLTCDHAGTRIPRRLGLLGLSNEELHRHIGWDIGAAEVSRRLSTALDATLILQPYSRLVIDCNRPLSSPDSIATISERTVIPGNADIHPIDAALRAHEIFQPYHACIESELERREREARPTILIAMHSFTPVYLGQARPWHIGVLYNRDRRLAHALRDALQAEPGIVVGDNEPYDVSDETDYAIPVYGERRGLLHVEVEIRQDLIMDATGQQDWALRLARLLPPLSE